MRHVLYFVLCGIFFYAVFHALQYFVPCSILCCTVHITIYRAPIHYFVPLVLCTMHCCAPLLTCTILHLCRALLCALHRSELCAVHHTRCSQMMLSTVEVAMEEFDCKWATTAPQGNKASHGGSLPPCEQPA